MRMKKRLTLYSVFLVMFSVFFVMQDASAQKRYKHLKKAKTEEGILVKTKTEKKSVKEAEPKELDSSPVTQQWVEEKAEVEKTENDVTAVASSENKKASFVKQVKQVKVKNLFNEKELAETASSLVFSSKAISDSKFGKMLSPEKSAELQPGMLFIIIGSVLMGVAIILWVVGTVVFLSSGYNAWIYILFIVLGVLSWFAGLALLAVGIVKLIKHKRGR